MRFTLPSSGVLQVATRHVGLGSKLLLSESLLFGGVRSIALYHLSVKPVVYTYCINALSLMLRTNVP